MPGPLGREIGNQRDGEGQAALFAPSALARQPAAVQPAQQRSFRLDISGNVAAIAALTLLPIFGIIALTLDTRNVMNTKREMQAAADAATLAAAIELLGASDDLIVKQAAESVMQSKVALHTDGLTCRMGEFVINELRDSVKVSWTCDEPSAVASTLGEDSMTFPVTATAKYNYGLDGCVLALGEYAWTGVGVTGSADVNLDSCAVISNSTKDSSIDMGGSGQLSTTCAYAAGGIQNPSTINTTGCLGPVQYGRATPDPYADLEVPEDVESWPCQSPTKTGKDSLYLSSGRYCNHISAKDDLVLEPGGVFVFDGIDLRMKSTWSNIVGDEVTLIFMNDGMFDNANGGSVNLTANPTGDYAGVLMYGDRNTMSRYTDIKINGNIDSVFEGALYFPNNDLTFVGGSSADSDCTLLIADSVTFSGNSRLAANCDELGAQNFGNINDVLLIE